MTYDLVIKNGTVIDPSQETCEKKEKNQKEEPDNGSGESDSIPEQPNEPIEEEVPQINF